MQSEILTFGANLELVEALTKYNARFFIVGGTAVRYHVPERDAGDLDILIEPSAQTASAVISALSSCPLISTVGLTVEKLTQPQKILIPAKIYYYADILKPAHDFDFDLHWAKAHDARIGQIPVKVASVKTLLALLVDSNEPKHASDISLLVSISD
ncbi:MAG: hypothetical protein Q7U57_19540 [Methylovulum sp.]|nr:hypothetical protein [Methylovulum sp.]